MIILRQKDFARFPKRDPRFGMKALTGFDRIQAKKNAKAANLFRMSEESWKKGSELEKQLFKKYNGDWSKLTEEERALLDKYNRKGGAIAGTQHKGSNPEIYHGGRREDMETAIKALVRPGGAYVGHNPHEIPYGVEVPIQWYRGEYKNRVPMVTDIAGNIRDARQTYKTLPTLSGEGRRTARVQELRNVNRQRLGLES